MSLILPVMVRYPSSSITPRSPVCIQRAESITSFVFSGLIPVAQHDRVPAGAQLLWLRPGEGVRPVTGSTILTSTWGCTWPTVPTRSLQRVGRPGLGGDRGRLCHAVTDGDLLDAHTVHYLLHDFERDTVSPP